MPKIPIYEQAAPQQQTYGTLMDPGAADPLFQANQSIARGVAQLGQAAGEYAQREQEAVNWTKEQNVKTKLDAARAEFETEKQAQPDHTKWGEMWEAKKQKIVGEIAGEKFAPVLRPRVDAMVNRWSLLTSEEIKQQARVAQVAQLEAEGIENVNFAVANGNGEGAVALVDEMDKRGIISPQKAAQMRVKIPREVDKLAANALIIDSPNWAPEALEEKNKSGEYENYKHLDDQTRRILIGQAKKAQASLRYETSQGFEQRIQDGEVVDEEELITARDDNKLLPSQVDRLMKKQFGTIKAQEQLSTAARAETMARALKPEDPEFIQKKYRILGMVTGFSENLRSNVQRALDEVQGSGKGDARDFDRQMDAVLERDIKSGVFGQADEEFITAYEKQIEDGFFSSPRVKRDSSGKVVYKQDPSTGEFVVDKKQTAANRLEFEKAWDRIAEIRVQMEAFRRSTNPPPDLVKQQEFYRKLIQGDRSKRAAGAVFNSLSGTR